MSLKPLQQAHFQGMATDELRAVVKDLERQLAYIAFSTTEAANKKRVEYRARLKFIDRLLFTRLIVNRYETQ